MRSRVVAGRGLEGEWGRGGGGGVAGEARWGCSCATSITYFIVYYTLSNYVLSMLRVRRGARAAGAGGCPAVEGGDAAPVTAASRSPPGGGADVTTNYLASHWMWASSPTDVGDHLFTSFRVWCCSYFDFLKS